MIRVPEKYSDCVHLLLASKTGKILLQSPRVSGVAATTSSTLAAHGQSLSATSIIVSDANYTVPQMACILAHELTHCYDFAYFDGSVDEYKKKGIGLTEVSAHFNQGKVLREFNAMKDTLPPSLAQYKDQIAATANSSTVFGKSVDWLTRGAVISHLSMTPHYGRLIGDPTSTGVGLWHDDMWTSAKIPFHCDENWDIYCSDESVRARALKG